MKNRATISQWLHNAFIPGLHKNSITYFVLYQFRGVINEKLVPEEYYRYGIHIEILLLILSFYLYFLGDAWRSYRKSFERIFESVGLYSSLQVQTRNISGNVEKKRDMPKYVRELKQGKSIVYYFTSNGISMEDWKKKQLHLENTMDCHIIKFEQEQHTKRFMKMYTIKAQDTLKDNYRWKDEYISPRDFEVVIREGVLEKVKINFEEVPHLLMAGETGAGKSVLQNCVTWQIIRKGGRVFMIDFKGGIELDHFKEFGPVMWERGKVIEVLRVLIKEHEKRVELFKEKGNNSEDYIKRLTKYMPGYLEFRIPFGNDAREEGMSAEAQRVHWTSDSQLNVDVKVKVRYVQKKKPDGLDADASAVEQVSAGDAYLRIPVAEEEGR